MYKKCRLSVVKLIKDTLPGFSYVDLDAHGDNQELPDALDIAGIVGFGMVDGDEVHDVVFGVAIITQNDQYLFRMTDAIDTVYSRLETGAKFNIYDPVTGAVIANAVVTEGTSVNPVSRAEARSATMVNVSAKIAMVRS